MERPEGVVTRKSVQKETVESSEGVFVMRHGNQHYRAFNRIQSGGEATEEVLAGWHLQLKRILSLKLR